jgi:hypothetical protein
MRYIVGYRGYEIIREDQSQPFQIFKDGKIATPATFWSFADARREVDYLKTR